MIPEAITFPGEGKFLHVNGDFRSSAAVKNTKLPRKMPACSGQSTEQAFRLSFGTVGKSGYQEAKGAD